MLLTSNRMMNPATDTARDASTNTARIFSCPEVSNSKRSTLQHAAPVSVGAAPHQHSALVPKHLAPNPHSPPQRSRVSSCSPAHGKSSSCRWLGRSTGACIQSLMKSHRTIVGLHIHVGIKGAVEGKASQKVHRLICLVRIREPFLYVIFRGADWLGCSASLG